MSRKCALDLRSVASCYHRFASWKPLRHCSRPDLTLFSFTPIELSICSPFALNLFSARPMSQALTKLDASIEAQQVRLTQLRARKQKLEAFAKTKLQGLARKQDTRRKVLLGAMLLERMDRNPQVKQQLMDQLASFLTRREDRLLFGLPVSSLSEV